MVADEILLKRAQDGDKAAYGELVRRYQDKVYGLAVRMLDTPEDARDASQEAFVKAYRALPDFDFRSGFATWLYRIATNTCLDLLRRRNRERCRSVPIEAGANGADNLRDSSPGPEETWLEQEKVRSLRRAVRELPENYRLVLVLHHYQGLGYRQVAEVTGLSEKTVGTRIHRAKKMLKERLLGGAGDALSDGKKNVSRISERRMPVI